MSKRRLVHVHHAERHVLEGVPGPGERNEHVSCEDDGAKVHTATISVNLDTRGGFPVRLSKILMKMYSQRRRKWYTPYLSIIGS